MTMTMKFDTGCKFVTGGRSTPTHGDIKYSTKEDKERGN